MLWKMEFDVGVGVNIGGGKIFLLLERGLKFIQVLGFVHVGVFVLGCSYWVFKLGCSGGCLL
jgi:hypothetical protein